MVIFLLQYQVGGSIGILFFNDDFTLNLERREIDLNTFYLPTLLRKQRMRPSAFYIELKLLPSSEAKAEVEAENEE